MKAPTPDEFSTYSPRKKYESMKEILKQGSDWVQIREREVKLMEAGLTLMPWERDYVTLQQKEIDERKGILKVGEVALGCLREQVQNSYDA